MIFRKAALLFLVPWFGFFASCEPIIIVANMYAQIAPEDDVTGENTTQAYVNFTEYEADLVGGNLQLTFDAPDPDGNNRMVIVLEPSSGDNFNTGEYEINGTNQNSFRTSLVVRREGSVGTIEAVANYGVVKLQAINIDEGVLQAIQAEFNVNFLNGGTADGWLKVTSP